MKKIKIVNVISKMVYGGTESVIYNYYKNMDLSKFDLYIITRDSSIKTAMNRFEDLGFKFIIVGDWEKYPFKVGKKLLGILKDKHFDIIHVHLTHTNFYFLILGYLSRIKVRISHSHLVSGKTNLITRVKHFVYKVLIKFFATNNMACSVDAAKELYWGKKDTYILNNAIDLEKYKYNEKVRDKYRNIFGISDKKVYGSIGRMTYQKNQLFLMDIFSEIKKRDNNSKFLLVGNGELKNKIIDRAKENGIFDDLIILSDRDDINNILQIIDVFILPSLYEGLGIVLIEAQESGIYCFASDKVVPIEAQATRNLEFVSLDLKAAEWARRIVCKESVRKDYTEILTKKGFNIEREAKKLEKYYLSIYKGEGK